MDRRIPRTQARAATFKDFGIWRLAGLVGIAVAIAATDARGQSEASAGEPEMIVSHGYSFYGDLKYGPDFEHFDFVNPDAPRGGEISFAALGTFDSMNPYSRRGPRGAAFVDDVREPAGRNAGHRRIGLGRHLRGGLLPALRAAGISRRQELGDLLHAAGRHVFGRLAGDGP